MAALLQALFFPGALGVQKSTFGGLELLMAVTALFTDLAGKLHLSLITKETGLKQLKQQVSIQISPVLPPQTTGLQGSTPHQQSEWLKVSLYFSRTLKKQTLEGSG